MSISRRDLLRGTAGVAAAGSLPLVLGAGNAVAASHPTLRTGSQGAAVLALQRRLTSLGYWLGAADGQFGDLTRQAVVAVQKVAGLARDGVCGPATWARVDAGVRPAARTTKGGVVEIDKKTQTLLVVNAGVVRWVFNTSTGSGRKYRQGGKDHIAVTPAGDFRVFRRVDGWDDGPLGKLYRPQYFNGGIAVHGYPVVPSMPESHGCCRVSLLAMDLLWGAGGMRVGTRVLVR
jgi:N-acetylmuramoyl-L-alanine amidase